MKKQATVLLLLISLSTYSQNNDCADLKYGVFESYEDDIKIGTIYRKGKYQIEKGLNGNKYTIGKARLEDCTFSLKSYEIKEDLDTITWSVSYKKIKKNHYSFIGKPKYLKINYTYVGEIKKIDYEIRDRKILDIFKELENNN